MRLKDTLVDNRLLSPAMLLWAVVAGILGAVATLIFREAIAFFVMLFSGNIESGIVSMGHHLPWFIRLCLPIVGGFIAGWFLLNRAKSSISSSNEYVDYMEVVAVGNGIIPFRVSIWRSLSCLVTVVTGGAIGREGSMVQLSALSSSLFGRWIKLEPSQLRLLVACGGAAGLAAAYNAPIAGSIFIVEIVLGAYAAESLALILLSAIISNLVMHHVPNYHPIYAMPPFPEIAGAEIISFGLLGIVCGIVATYYLYLRSRARYYFTTLKWSPPYQLALGGAIVGLLSIAVPEVWGNGFSSIESILHTPWPWEFLLVVFICKFIAILATSGSGAVGGVFTPTIFMGAALGGLFGYLVCYFLPSYSSATYAYAIIGMGAFLAAATQVPLMALLMILEMTHSYQVTLPLAVACILAYFVARVLGRPAMYQITSYHQEKNRIQAEISEASISKLIEPAQTVMSPDTKISDLIPVFSDYAVKYVYIVNEQEKYLGCVALKDITHALYTQKNIESQMAKDYLVAHPALLSSDFPIKKAFEKILNFPGERCPVIDDEKHRRFVGVIYKSSLLKMYNRLHNW